jgi:hypothetical protein
MDMMCCCECLFCFSRKTIPDVSLLCKLDTIFSCGEICKEYSEKYAMNIDDDYMAIIETLMISHVDFLFRAERIFHVIMQDRRINESSNIISLFYKLYKILLKMRARDGCSESPYIKPDNILYKCDEVKMLEICGNIFKFISSICLMENKYVIDCKLQVEMVELVMKCDIIIEKCMMLMQTVIAHYSV